MGRRGSVPLGHAVAEVVVRAARGRGRPRAARTGAPADRARAALMDWLSPGCLVGSALTVASLLADPDGAPERVAETARAQLVELETLGRVAIGARHRPGAAALAARPSSRPRSRP